MNPTRYPVRFTGGQLETSMALYVHDGGPPPPVFEVWPFTFPGVVTPGIYQNVGAYNGELVYVLENEEPAAA